MSALTPEQLAQIMEPALRAYLLEDYKQTVALLNSALRHHPGNVEMLTVRAFALLRQGNNAAALRDVLAARDAASSDAEELAGCWENVGGVAHAAGRFQMAVDAFRTAMQYKDSEELRFLKRAAKQAAANPGAANRGLTLLACSLEEGKLALSLDMNDAAIRLFTQAMDFAPHRAEAYIGRSMAYRFKGCLQKAVADATMATHLAPANGDAHAHLGLAYWGLKNYAEARESFALSVRMAPDDEENRELLRMVEQKIKRKENKKKLIMAGLKVGAAIIKMMNSQQ